jgi:hypothetical protein
MTHEEIQDLLAPRALDALPAAERAAVDAHVASGCDGCRRALEGFRAAALLLPLAVQIQAPPARVKERLMAGLGARRKSRLPVLCAAALALLVLLAGGRALFRPRLAPLEVLEVAGELLAGGRPARPGDRLRPGLTLSTPDGSTADLRLASRAVFRLKPGAEAVVRRDGAGFRIDLRRGGLLSVVKTGTPYAVSTPVAVAAVRGTVFYVEASSPEAAYACICRGRFHLEAPGLSQDEEAPHHKGFSLSAAGGQTRAAPGGMLNHTDDEIDRLESFLP